MCLKHRERNDVKSCVCPRGLHRLLRGSWALRLTHAESRPPESLLLLLHHHLLRLLFLLFKCPTLRLPPPPHGVTATSLSVGMQLGFTSESPSRAAKQQHTVTSTPGTALTVRLRSSDSQLGIKGSDHFKLGASEPGPVRLTLRMAGLPVAAPGRPGLDHRRVTVTVTGIIESLRLSSLSSSSSSMMKSS
jgi:hypothetical protein